jgi:hypothetical protein
MKKTLVLILAFSSIAYSGIAQESEIDLRQKFNFGVKVGANLSTVYDTQGEQFDADPKIGFVTGAFLTIPIWRFLGVQPEIMFSQRGFRATGVILGSPYKFTRTISYIDLPLLATFKLNNVVTVVAGPQLSFQIWQRDSFSTGTSPTQVQEFNNDNIRKNTLSLLTGLDFNFNHIVLGTRVGLDVQDNIGKGTVVTPRYKNVWVQATLGYRFYN